MEIRFNLPYSGEEDGIFFTVDMDSVPRKGDEISLARIEGADFNDWLRFDRFKASGYWEKNWTVSKVIWSPMQAGYSYVNIILEMIKDAAPPQPDQAATVFDPSIKPTT